jgi:NADH:ubiquinone oxidoreductase subunit 5 (subunit L)/multisubunit Na+/H+ antiporter MnhA subunit
MLNNAIYKSCLFLSGGAVEKKAGTTDLEKLGGFAKIMPITFIAFLIASLSISGVPPFNGFVSKWMIYQGVIEAGKNGGYFWIVWLIAAMVGSALTLASFMKLIHAMFLGQPSQDRKVAKDKRQETGWAMLIPTVVLAALCVVFGVFAYSVPLKMFILPCIEGVVFSGVWQAGLATVLILLGIVVGFGIYLLGSAFKAREAEIFTGGEIMADVPGMRVSGTEFYNTIQDIGVLKFIYRLAQEKVFDIYEVGTKWTFGFNKMLRYLHNGVLSTYISWCLLGMLILFWILLK